MRIAIIGSGAMGMLFGAKLKQSGNEVIMIAKRAELIDKLNKEGIELESERGREIISVRAKRAEEVREDIDLAILFTKSIHTEAAMSSAREYLGKDSYVLTLQNGIGNIEIINKYIPYENILAGITMFASDVVGNGRINSYGTGYTKIMTANGEENKILGKINKVLDDAGLESEITPDVFVTIWEKLAFNSAMNASAAICRVPSGGLALTEEGRQLVYNTAKETAAVGRSHGVNVSEERVLDSIKSSFKEHKDHFPSMAQDVFKKKQTESEFINGNIVKKAREVNMPAPYNEVLFALMHTIENTYDIQY